MKDRRIKFKIIYLIIISLFLCACETGTSARKVEFKSVEQIFWENVFESLSKENVSPSENPNAGASGETSDVSVTDNPDGTDISDNTLVRPEGASDNNESVSSNSISECDVFEKLEELGEVYPDGKYWNHGEVTDTPCNHDVYGTKYCNSYSGAVDVAVSENDPHFEAIQCKAFASLISDSIFGADAPVATYSSFDDIRVGDIYRVDFNRTDGHSAVIIEKGEDYVKVLECNGDFQTCKISWGRTVKKSYLEKNKALYITRYEDYSQDAIVWDTTGYVHAQDVSTNEK